MRQSGRGNTEVAAAKKRVNTLFAFASSVAETKEEIPFKYQLYREKQMLV